MAEKQGNTIYVQVAYLLASDETVNMEFGNLKQIKDRHSKYVVSMDAVSSGINQVISDICICENS